MSKKYVIDLPDDAQYILINGASENHCYTRVEQVDDLEELNSDYINEHFGELQDEAYQRGLEEGRNVGIKDGMCEAWEAAKKIVCDDSFDWNTLMSIFNSRSFEVIFGNFSASDAVARLKAYEGNKDEPIKAGDIVERYIDGKLDSKGIYLQEEGGYWRCLFDTGAVLMTFAYPKGQFKKTGKHYDIQSILEAMRT